MMTGIELLEHVRTLESRWQVAMAGAIAVNPDAPDSQECRDIDAEFEAILESSRTNIGEYRFGIAEIATHFAAISPESGAIDEDNGDPYATATAALLQDVLATAPKTRTPSVLDQCSRAARAEHTAAG